MEELGVHVVDARGLVDSTGGRPWIRGFHQKSSGGRAWTGRRPPWTKSWKTPGIVENSWFSDVFGAVELV